MIKFGASFPESAEPRVLADMIKKAEEVGFEYAWVADHFTDRDSFSILALAAERTSKIHLGTGVVNPYSRHPSVLASTIATIDEVSSGRAILGISSGGMHIEKELNISQKTPATACKEAIEVIRRLLTGDIVDYNGKTVKLSKVKLEFHTRKNIPIYIGARGPKMLQLVGEIADGVLAEGITTQYINFMLQQIQKGARRNGRRVESIDIAILLPGFSITDNAEAAKKKLKPSVVHMTAGTFLPQVLELLGTNSREVAPMKLYFDKGDMTTAASFVTDEMVDALTIIGSEEECIRKIDELSRRGIKQIVIPMPMNECTYKEPLVKNEEQLEKIGKIIQYFKENSVGVT